MTDCLKERKEVNEEDILVTYELYYDAKEDKFKYRTKKDLFKLMKMVNKGCEGLSKKEVEILLFGKEL
jgi:hypothetical protein